GEARRSCRQGEPHRRRGSRRSRRAAPHVDRRPDRCATPLAAGRGPLHRTRRSVERARVGRDRTPLARVRGARRGGRLPDGDPRVRCLVSKRRVMKVEIVAVSPAEEPVLNRLMQLYVYDFSEFMGFDIANDGTFSFTYRFELRRYAYL